VQSGASIIAVAALIVATATALIIIAVAILWDRDILLCRWYSYLYFFLELCVYIYMLKVFLLPRSLFLNCSLPLYTVGSESNEPQLTKHKISSQKK
jgi:hypothetical protein